MILAQTIVLTHPHDTVADETGSYSQADELIRRCAQRLKKAERVSLRVLVVFEDRFVWTSALSVDRPDESGEHFVQRAIKADWEFGAGVRPAWWPQTPEADRMWGVHYREERDNQRVAAARMRLDRYDLRPLVLTPLPSAAMAYER
jgi:hypothetical protein